ncbi:MAG TPA: hypothetical protein DHN33_02390 [Eubacteriaceae bacterium]|nr:hypothetical protein [Eubacteriaceae bacterium]
MKEAIEETMEEAFEEIGFDEYREITTDEIIIEEDVFKQCEKNICGSFGKNHACPPQAGTEAERKARVNQYKKGYLLNKFGSINSRKEMEESMKEVEKAVRALRKRFRQEDVLVLGVGPCTLCKECTALEGDPCRHPELIEYSMEACGIDVVRMSMNKKMKYNAGGGKVGYFSLVLYDRAEN